jgi:protease-4
MMFASALGALVAVGIVFLVLCVSLAAIIASANSKPEYVPEENTVFKLALNGNISENVEQNPFAELFGGNELGISLKDVIRAIRTAKDNDNVKGIYIEAGGMFSGGTTIINAIREELKSFKESGKFIVSYADNYSQGAYYLCSVADKVFMNPLGLALLYGRASQYEFYKGLGEKIGVDFLVFKVGTYKGAVEPYMLNKLSDENREQITSYQTEIWDYIIKNIAESRNITIEDINKYADEGYFLTSREKAVEMRLIDDLKYKPEVEDYIKELAGQTDDDFRVAGIGKINSIKNKEKKKKSENKIAVLYAEGEITTKVVSSLPQTNGINEDMVKAIIKLRKDEKVKAVVMRVNSPGGSAYVSEQIWREIVELKKVKPVVVSMSSVAASGGYYISCAASKIYAEETTLTGSIGIFGMIPNFAELYKKVGLTTDVVKTNKFSDMGDITRPWRDDEKALMQAQIENGYDIFLTRCADGRGKTKAEIDAVAQGRVWTGTQALEKGLIDAIGGMEEAVASAAELAGITDKDYDLQYSSGNKDSFMDFIQKQFNGIQISFVKDAIGEKEYDLLKNVQRIKSQTGVLARLPYEFTEAL